MVASALDLPDTMLSGDLDQGNLATAKTMDRPTELGMINEQTLAAEFLRNIFRYATDAAIRAGKLPGTEEQRRDFLRHHKHQCGARKKAESD
jgi:hypothetical protein